MPEQLDSNNLQVLYCYATTFKYIYSVFVSLDVKNILLRNNAIAVDLTYTVFI